AARAAGRRYARLNLVSGTPFLLRDNPDNLAGGELVVGTLSAPLSRDLDVTARTGFDPYHLDLNAVRVVTRRGRAAASSTYYVDRDVVGFRLSPPLATPPGQTPPF